MPPLLAVSASEGINILRSTPSILSTLHENIRTARSILERLDSITIPSHPASPVIHIYVRSSSTATLHPSSAASLPSPPGKPSNPASPVSRDSPQFDIELEEKLLQDVVDEALAQGVMITRAKRLRGQELVEPKPSIRLALTSALTRKETERAVGIVKAALVKVLGKRR
jgi:serine palmitoyltransferase